jgi:tetratricopeptide (TPR) repeat protein
MGESGSDNKRPGTDVKGERATFEQIQALVAERNFEQAAEELTTLVSSLGVAADKERRLLARCLRSLFRHEDALATLEAIQKKNGDDYADRGWSLWSLKRTKEAIESLRTSLLLEESARARTIMALVILNERNPRLLNEAEKKEIVTHLEEAVRQDRCPETAFITLDDCISPYAEGSGARRQEILERALAHFPASEAVRERLAGLQIDSLEKPDCALATLAPLLSTKRPAIAHLWLAFRAFREIRDFAGALAVLERIPDFVPDGVSINKVKGDMLVALGRPDDAIEAYNQDIASSDTEARVVGLFSRAQVNLAADRIGPAAKDAENAVAICFEKARFSFYYGQIELSADDRVFYDFSECIEVVCRAFLEEKDLGPIAKGTELFGRLSFLYYRTLAERHIDDEPEDAEKWLLIAEESAPHPAICKDLSYHYAAKSKHAMAVGYHLAASLSEYQGALREGREFNARACAYHWGIEGTPAKLTKKETTAVHKVALEMLEGIKAEADSVHSVVLPFFLSTWSKVLGQQEMWSEIASVSQTLLAYTNGNRELLWEHAYSNLRAKKFAEAEESYRHVLELDPNDASALHNLSILVEKQDPIEAMELQERAVALAPDDEKLKKRNDGFSKLRTFQKLADAYLSNPTPFETLSVRQRLYLGAVLRLCLTEDQSSIRSLDESNGKLGPILEYENSILRSLWHDRLLAADPKSEASALFLGEKGDPRIQLRGVRWLLNVSSISGLSREQILHRLLNPEPLADDELEEATSLWREVALEESLEYFSVRKDRVSLPIEIGEKTRDYFEELLKDYSVGQVYTIIFKAISWALTVQREKGLPDKHAANIAASCCKTYGEKAKQEGWNLKVCRRDFDCPQSIVSQMLFEPMLGIGQAGFENRPGLFAGLKFEVSSADKKEASSETDTAPSTA